MKLIKPKAELLLQQPGLEGVYKQIELAGRTCYKSTDKITEDSAKPFVDRMINSNHLAMLEHGTVYLHQKGVYNRLAKYDSNKYSKYKFFVLDDDYTEVEEYVTTNLRVLVENNWLDDLQYLCEPTEFHEKRYTFRLVTSIGVTRELNRHRVNSIAEESTRYCNYSKDKFGSELIFIIPNWDMDDVSQAEWINAISNAEESYLSLIEQGWKPQEAREVLPLCLKSEIIHTAFASDWKHFFDLRYFGKTGAPHPNMVELAGLMAKEADRHGIWNELCNEQVNDDN